MAAEDLAAGHLALAGGTGDVVPPEIRLFRLARGWSRAAEGFWRAGARRLRELPAESPGG